jgi:UbiA prenyltransferase family
LGLPIARDRPAIAGTVGGEPAGADNGQALARPSSSDLWAHGRPVGLLLIPLLPLVGFGFAHWDHALALRAPSAIAWVAAAWALLHLGTMWLNAALDRDEGAVLFGQSRALDERGARHVARWGYVALTGAVALATIGNGQSGICAALAAALATAYSHPRLAWKARKLGGLLVNVVGYGVLSPLAGWLVVDAPASPRALATLAVFSTFVASFYFGAQIFQADEDRLRGYRTFVACHGAAATARATRWCWRAAVLAAMVLGAVGWFPDLVLAVAPLGWWADRSIALGRAHAERFASRSFVFGLGLLALASLAHLRSSGEGAGHATRSGYRLALTTGLSPTP